MKWDDSDYRGLTEKVIRGFYNVHNGLGPGFLEKVYQRALFIELENLGLSIESEKRYPVLYTDEEVGTYIPDIVVEGKVVVEIKAGKGLDDNHKAQLIAQLRISKLLIGFLVNFGQAKLEFRRIDNYHELKQKNLWTG